VAEIYGLVDEDGNVLDGVSVHHIVERSDAKDKKSPFFGQDVNGEENLYPFTSHKEHEQLHKKLGDTQPKKKERVVYKRRK